MKYKQIIDLGQSELSLFAMYSHFYGDLIDTITDYRASNFADYEGFKRLLLEHFGAINPIMTLLYVNHTVDFILLPDIDGILSITRKTPSLVDKTIEEAMTNTGPVGVWGEEQYSVVAEPTERYDAYTIVTGISVIYPRSKLLKAELFFEEYDKIKFAKNEVAKGIVHFIMENHNRLHLQGAKIDVETYGDDIIEDNYNNNFKPAYEKLNNFITEDEGGFVLLKGPPGTGKSSMILHLIGIADRLNKKFVLVPSSFGDILTSPSFMKFAVDSLKDAVIVVEDAEHILRSREQDKSNQAVTNILNITDGLLSKLLNIKIIATVNVEDSIDEALLRKGRLKMSYYFDKLDTPKANKLLKKLEINRTVNSPTTLADIYGISDTVDFKGEVVGKNTIGFK